MCITTHCVTEMLEQTIDARNKNFMLMKKGHFLPAHRMIWNIFFVFLLHINQLKLEQREYFLNIKRS